MIKLLDILSGSVKKPDFSAILDKGAIIIDVRSKGEFDTGYAKGSLNIPYNELEEKMTTLDKSKPVIICCISGMRSESAKRLLISNGFKEVYNGGSWTNMKRYGQSNHPLLTN